MLDNYDRLKQRLYEDWLSFDENELPKKETVAQSTLDRVKGQIDDFIWGVEHKKSRQLRVWRVVSGIAAILVIALSVCVFKLGIIHYNADSHQGLATVSTGEGERATVILPDGSQILLNQCSNLSYPVSLAMDSVRCIEFSGEGYFNIASTDRHTGFNVVTNDVIISVTGTEFNVNAYNHSASIIITLDKGGVNLLPVSEARKSTSISPVELKSGQEAIYDRNTGCFDVRETHSMANTAWVRHQISFNDVSPDSLIMLIENQYNITLNDNVKSLMKERFTGSIPDDNLSEALTILGKLYKFEPSKSLDFPQKN